jgi:hypothetical protein
LHRSEPSLARRLSAPWTRYTLQLVQIDTTTGKGTAKGSAFTFTNGWSGAGVTTKVTINVPPPRLVR